MDPLEGRTARIERILTQPDKRSTEWINRSDTGIRGLRVEISSFEDRIGSRSNPLEARIDQLFYHEG